MPAIWIRHPSVGDPTYLLTRMANGSLSLLNADAEDAPIVRLALQTKRKVDPFVSADGRLQVIEVLGDSRSYDFCDLCWHTIDASTGETLASEHKLKWHPAFCRDCRGISANLLDDSFMYQAVAQRILALADVHTIVVLDAVSRREETRIVVTPQGPELAGHGWRMNNLCWAPSGAWLSVDLLASSPDGMFKAGSAVASEVHIYDASSGARLQWVVLPSTARLSWSPSLDLAAVFAPYEPCDPPLMGKWGSAENAGGKVRVREPDQKGIIRILDPARRLVMQICAPGRQGGWNGLEWSPCGALIMASPGLYSCAIVDAVTGNQLHCPKLWWTNPSWASETEAAYLPEPDPNSHTFSCSLKFVCCNGIWQVRQKDYKAAGRMERCRISPDGKVVAGVFPARPSSNSKVYHRNLETGAICTTIENFKRAVSSRGAFSNYAKLPRAWPQVHAWIHISDDTHHRPGPSTRSSTHAIHQHSQERDQQRCLKLVEGQAHRVVGSWTPANLLGFIDRADSPTAAPCDTMNDCIWAPNGNHLAVFCNKSTWVLVLTFREPA